MRSVGGRSQAGIEQPPEHRRDERNERDRPAPGQSARRARCRRRNDRAGRPWWRRSSSAAGSTGRRRGPGASRTASAHSDQARARRPSPARLLASYRASARRVSAGRGRPRRVHDRRGVRRLCDARNRAQLPLCAAQSRVDRDRGGAVQEAAVQLGREDKRGLRPRAAPAPGGARPQHGASAASAPARASSSE